MKSSRSDSEKREIYSLRAEVRKVRKEVEERTINYIMAGFGLVAGLAWNEAIRSLIEHAVPLDKNTVLAKFIYALLMTLVLATIVVYLSRRISKAKK